jgi:hypothetical protein
MRRRVLVSSSGRNGHEAALYRTGQAFCSMTFQMAWSGFLSGLRRMIPCLFRKFAFRPDWPQIWLKILWEQLQNMITKGVLAEELESEVRWIPSPPGPYVLIIYVTSLAPNWCAKCGRILPGQWHEIKIINKFKRKGGGKKRYWTQLNRVKRARISARCKLKHRLEEREPEPPSPTSRAITNKILR